MGSTTSNPADFVTYTANEVFSLPLPYVNFLRLLDPEKLSSSPSEREDSLDYIGMQFLSLLDAMIQFYRLSSSSSSNSKSFNLLITKTFICLVPRSKEKTGDGRDVEMSVNSLGFGGMMLTKTERELEWVKRMGPVEVLRGVGVQWEEMVVDG